MARGQRQRGPTSSHHRTTSDLLSSHPFVALTRSIGALQNQLALLGFPQFDTDNPHGSIAWIDLTGFQCSAGEAEPAETQAINTTASYVAASGLDATTVWELLYRYMPYFRRTELGRVETLFGEWWKQIVKQRRLRSSLVSHAQKILPPLDKDVIDSLKVAVLTEGQRFEDAYALAKGIKSKIQRLKTLLGDRQGKHTNKEAHYVEHQFVRAFLKVVPGQNHVEACRQTLDLLRAWAGNRAPKDWDSIQARHRDLIPARNRKPRVRTHWD